MNKIVLWVSDLDAQIAFYSNLLEIELVNQAQGFAELAGPFNSVFLHELPIEYRASVPLTVQLPAQVEVAIKPVFLVDDLDIARKRLNRSLVSMVEPKKRYGAATYLDVVDPEGNVIQLEEKTSASSGF